MMIKMEYDRSQHLKVIRVHSLIQCPTLLFHLQAGSVARAPC